MKTKIPTQAIEEMVNYLWNSEAHNFFDNGCDDGHIFCAALAAAEWLSTQPDAAKYWARAVKDFNKKLADTRDDEAA